MLSVMSVLHLHSHVSPAKSFRGISHSPFLSFVEGHCFYILFDFIPCNEKLVHPKTQKKLISNQWSQYANFLSTSSHGSLGSIFQLTVRWQTFHFLSKIGDLVGITCQKMQLMMFLSVVKFTQNFLLGSFERRLYRQLFKES